ncbi:TetR/AcrR family transcriptional regulator [Patulibacter minatonensis]|uniref:TetR/AcrR family transcriptional regulator n=1 Tax=Patulibacter minatonensis TaxID=298163 RepID=UPI0004B5B1D8|nr:TetR/AcrR family transcriptional regulator [Patulibacter minatonensis]
MAKEPSKSASRRQAARDDATSGYEDRRREILRVGAEVFKARGLRGATLSHVAEALGTDRASLYYYFSSKEELFHEVVGEATRTNLEAARAIHAEDVPAPVKLRRLMEGLMVSYADFYPVLYVLIQENLSHVAPEHSGWADEMRQVNREYERVLVAIVQEGQDAGTLRVAGPAWVVAYGIIGMLGWSNRWFVPERSTTSAADIGAGFADAVLDGIVSPPTA